MAEPFARAFRLAPVDGSIWSLTLDLPGEKVNKLNRVVMTELGDLLPELERRGKTGEIGALIFRSGKKDQFIAGADITLIQAAKTAEDATSLAQQGQRLLNAWEDLPFPTVAAVQGPCLGGGCEWALASSAIVMADDSATRIGLPEVMLGVIPGMGGCVRLPRKVGLVQGLDFILSSKTLSGEKALRAGWVEAVLTAQQFESQVLAWVKKNLASLQAGRRLAREPKLGGAGGPVGNILEHTAMGRAVILRKAREGVLAKTAGRYPAPLEVIEVLRDTAAAYSADKVRGEDRDEALSREARGFGRCASTEVSKNLIRLFFLTEAVKKKTGLEGISSEAGQRPKEDAPRSSETRVSSGDIIRQAGVLGAGVMGGGIAQLFADRAISVRMKDLNTEALAVGVQAASRLWQKQMKRKRLTVRGFQQRLNLIAPTLTDDGFQSCDLVIEAIVEKMDVKKSVIRSLEKVVRPDCVIATNTSSLSVSQMQEGMQDPSRFVGMHFFNPVHRMPLVEVIRGKQSSDRAVAAVFALAKRIGKTPVVVQDSPGFLVNRLLAPYLNEAMYLLSEGAGISDLDSVLLEFGMPMGPVELIDEVGIDVGEKVAHVLFEAFGARMQPCPMTSAIVKSGRLGKKNGKGFYLYSDGGKSKSPDPEVESLMGPSGDKDPGRVSRQDMLDRCLLPMINEASRALSERVVGTAGEVDLGMIMGMGFPPFRGGLLRYADELGAREVVKRLRDFASRVSVRFEPSQALLEMAEAGKGFYSEFSESSE